MCTEKQIKFLSVSKAPLSGSLVLRLRLNRIKPGMDSSSLSRNHEEASRIPGETWSQIVKLQSTPENLKILNNLNCYQSFLAWLKVFKCCSFLSFQEKSPPLVGFEPITILFYKSNFVSSN